MLNSYKTTTVIISATNTSNKNKILQSIKNTNSNWKLKLYNKNNNRILKKNKKKEDKWKRILFFTPQVMV